MIFSTPVYVYKSKGRPGSPGDFTVRPLFFFIPAAKDEKLPKAMSRLARELRKHCDGLAKGGRHDALAAYTFSPPITDRLLNLTLDLADGRHGCRFLIVTLHGLGRTLAFAPALGDLWFELGRGEDLTSKAEQVLSQFFRERAKKEDSRSLPPAGYSIDGKAWVASIEYEVNIPPIAARPERQIFAALGGHEPLDGGIELRKTGRCLDELYPDELSRVVGRDSEVKDLTALLAAADRQPVLLIGPRLVGKTAIVQEYVYNLVSNRKQRHSARNNVWLLSAQRLISGMKYVGQWEERVMAIAGEAAKRDHVLYFDDILGLYEAGKHSMSNLSIADVLKPIVEKHEFRMLAEMTPETLRIFKERDRGFSDMFQVLWVNEPDDRNNCRILISLMRQLENRHGSEFGLDVLPTVLELERRYGRDASFPGKAARFLNQLAVKYAGLGITRQLALDEFKGRSGLSVAFLDARHSLDWKVVARAISQRVKGQDAAVEACADAVTLARARLNDPSRPLACLLFLGPTGVGKTQCAKSLAAYLFGRADRLTRFDMNEFSAASAVPRLVGTFDQPEGLLTASVRRQPFAVILLDEIEKAHPTVFNLLLQVMGDGRLTDARGRTADFTNSILIMTSNLGARDAGRVLGFGHDASRERAIYVDAAEKFFRPEFFNRLDRIVGFARLDRPEMEMIAQDLMRSILARGGLAARKCLLVMDEAAEDQIIKRGYHPRLGARALKRELEREVVRPVARHLAAMNRDTPAIVTLSAAGEHLIVSVEGLTGASSMSTLGPLNATPSGTTLPSSGGSSTLLTLGHAIDRIEERISGFRPQGEISTDSISPEQMAYFKITEQVKRARYASRRAFERLNVKPRAPLRVPKPRRDQSNLRRAAETELWQRVATADDVPALLKEIAATAKPFGLDAEDSLAKAVAEVCLLHALAESAPSEHDRRTLIWPRPIGLSKRREQELGEYLKQAARGTLSLEESGSRIAELDKEITRPHAAANWLSGIYTSVFEQLLAETHSFKGGETVAVVVGAIGRLLAESERGLHLFFYPDGQMLPISLIVEPIQSDITIGEAIAMIDVSATRWPCHGAPLPQGERWPAPGEAPRGRHGDPADESQVVRVYAGESGPVLDLRTGFVVPNSITADELKQTMLSSLPLPPGLGGLSE
ncbi:MAG TPA: AAA family ATPase [Blastocatellia bacterium]|nr:AAA family ATPase [Blastocatellia bacterium]